ncbi:MAG: hypothetical protein H5T47_06415 [Archaeoglobi archaeon]|nr:hypothetical protein [Candidatus Mnemosynella bozhongmuii]
MRGGKGFAILKLDDISGYFRKYIEEVENFLQERVEDVLNDIASYISERNSKRKFSRRLGEPEAPFLTKASSKAIAEKILREYSAELLTFGAGWVVENHRGELGIATEEPAVIELLMKSLKKFGKEMMRRATRGVEYLAAMLLHDQADRIVRGGIRAGMTCEWSDLRAIIMRDFTEALVKYGGKDLQLIIMGYAYKLLEASYAEMPEDIRRALRYFENEEKG